MSVSSSEVREGLLDLINAEISVDPSIPVFGETDLLATGLVDSLGIVEVVAWMEDTIGVEIDPIDIVRTNFQTVDLMVAFAERLANG
ncbi:phosphopantetheine-binding protein [Ilumatobacter sp.]|uniref:phosphopantetheine-binding protein n=1 Tax=Ilumatobacter sp. TaxID=1967498 RepID=UPI003AF97261